MTKKQAIIRGLKSFDYLLALTVIGVSIFGVVMIYAAHNHEGVTMRNMLNFGHLWRLQRMHVISGAVLMLIFACIDYRIITKMYPFIYAFMMLLLIAVMLVGAGETGTARWLAIPLPVIGPLSLQPSEFAKIFMILFLAKFLEIKKDDFNRILWLGFTLILIGVPVLLVFRQPSLSAALVVLFGSLVTLFAAGLKLRYIVAGTLLVVPVLIILWFDLQRAEPLFLERIFQDYMIDRVRTVIYPIPGSPEFYQAEHSIRAIAAGGLTGVGFMNHRTPLILPHNDLIFSVVAEQFGFVGGAVIIGVIMFMVVKCIFIALKAVDLQGRLIAAGVAGMLIFETFVHVGVGTGLLPVTGMPFPFLSYGGSMIWVHMIAMGIVLNIGLKRDKDEFAEDE